MTPGRQFSEKTSAQLSLTSCRTRAASARAAGPAGRVDTVGSAAARQRAGAGLAGSRAGRGLSGARRRAGCLVAAEPHAAVSPGRTRLTLRGACALRLAEGTGVQRTHPGAALGREGARTAIPLAGSTIDCSQ